MSLADLPPEVLNLCCPESHRNTLCLTLCSNTKPALLINPSQREVVWTNHNLPSIGVVLYSHSLMGFDPHSIIRLTLIDPHEQLSALVTLARLTHLTIAFSTACNNMPHVCKLSKICPTSVEQIKLIRAPVVVDRLPDTCSSLSVTRCKTTIFQAPTRSLKELRLHECKCICLESLVNAFPRLESLSLDVAGSVPYVLLKLQSLRSLSMHLTAPPAEELRYMLPRLAGLKSLEVTVARRCDVGAAEQIFRTAATEVMVQHVDTQEAKRSMLKAKYLQELLCPSSSW